MTAPVYLTLTCSCHNLDHALRFTHDSEDDTLSVEMTFEHGRGFLQRVVTAWRYVFGRTCTHGGVADVIVKHEDRRRLRQWVASIDVPNLEPSERQR